MRELVEQIAKALVDDSDNVKVTEVEGETVTVIELRVAQPDLGKVIGKQLRGAPKELDAEQADLGRFDAIISSMTTGERTHPDVINGSRRQRIARGSGTSVQDVNRLLKQYAQLRKLMKQLKGKRAFPGRPTLRG